MNLNESQIFHYLVLIVTGCSRLKHVNEVHLLSHVCVVDRELSQVPDWFPANASMLQTLSIVGMNCDDYVMFVV
jgi:hypothetical protein